MNTILFYTIVIIVILIICFFLTKNLTGINKNIENFHPINTNSQGNPDHEHNSYGVTGGDNANRNVLENYFYSAVTSLDSSRNDQCLTKYLSVYDLAISDTAPGAEDPTPISLAELTYECNNLNSCLENFDGDVLYVTGGATLRKQKVTNFETNFNNETTPFDSKIYEPHRHKFSNATDFIDFGVKSKHNYFIKKYKYRIPDDKKQYLFNFNLRVPGKDIRIKNIHIKNQEQIKREFDIESVLYFVNEVTFICDISHKTNEDLISEYNQADVSAAGNDKRYKYYVKLMKLRNNILKDGFLNKFNCKYFTYLFYSFNKGIHIFGDYIRNIFSVDEQKIIEDFFDDINCEGLYKLFILSMKHDNCHIIGEHEEAGKPKLDNIFKRKSFIPVYNTTAGADNSNFEDILELYTTFNLKQYFFFSKLNYDGMVRGCDLITNEEKCTPELTFNQCSWDTNESKCKVDSANMFERCVDYNSLENETDRQNQCEGNNQCDFNDNKMCYPKPCLTEDPNTQELGCNTDFNHCDFYPEYSKKDGVYREKCYDNARVMYSTKEGDTSANVDIPQNFMTNVDLHLNDCTNNITDCKNTSITSCKKLDKNMPRYNPTEFQTCVSDELIDKGNFYNCFNLNNEEDCDTAYGDDRSCFWQDGKCYNRDAPLEWVNPNSNEFGLQDMTDCKNFITDYECPTDRCVWHNDICKRKSEHPYYPTGPVSEEDTGPETPDITVPLDKTNINCLLINNTSNSDPDAARAECLHNKCHWDRQKSICMNDINRFCELHKSKTSCLDSDNNGLANFDAVSHQNKCRWVEDKSGIFPDDDGFCIDTRMNQPCGLFDKDSCPLDSKVDNMGNIISESHCKLDDNDKCVNKSSDFKDDYDSCQYNYLNIGATNGCDEIKCQKMDNIYGSAVGNTESDRDSPDDDYMVTQCSPRELLPCSTLTDEHCKSPGIVGSKCIFDDGSCTFPRTLDDISASIQNLTDPNHEDYQEIQDINSQLQQMEYISNQNKKYYIKERGSISGAIDEIDEDANQNQYLKINSDRIDNITLDDLLTIRNSAGRVLYTVVVTNVDIISKNVYIEDTDPNNISKKIDASLRNITWTLNEPNLGMFGSYQQAQAMIDSRKISDFYKNFS